MFQSAAHVLETLHRVGEAVDARLSQAPGGPRRVAALAEMLRSLVPGASLYACMLGREATMLDEAGEARPEWVRPVGDEQRSPLPGLVLVREEVAFRDRLHGALVLAVPEEDAGGLESARIVLCCTAQALAARLEIEALARDDADDAALAEVGEISSPLTHEFNNFLNALMLHLAVMQYKLPQAVQPGLEQVRLQAVATAALIRQFQNSRRRNLDPQRSVDLNRAVCGAVRALGGAPGTGEGVVETAIQAGPPAGDGAGGPPVMVPCRLDLAAEPPVVIGDYKPLQRMCVFLLRNAAGAAAAAGGGVVVRTSRSGEGIVLRVEDGGAPVPPQRLAQLFEASAVAREGTNSLELAACRTIARRHKATIRAEDRPEGGAALVVEWGGPKG